MAQTNVVVSPGTEAVIAIRVRNVGDVTETYAFIPTGISQGWSTVNPSTVTLYPGADEVVQVALRPPRSYAIPAGPTPLVVRVVPHGNPDDVATAEGTITVLEYDDRRLVLAQPVLRAKRRHEFDVVFENLGNNRSSCRLGVVDHTNRLVGRFDPPSLGVDPGMNESARLRIKARRRRFRRGRPLPFTVTAMQDGHEPTSTTGTLLQEPIISGRFIGRVVGLVATAGLLTAGWFHLVKPEIQDAADRAVSRAGLTAAVSIDPTATTLAPAVPVTVNPASPATVPPVVPVQPAPQQPPAAAGTAEAVDDRLEVRAALGQSGSAQYPVPEGRTLRLTDFLVQNPNNDLGRVFLYRNAEPLYEWSLENIRDGALQTISAIEFKSGENVTFGVFCQGVGNTEIGECAVAATFVGTLT